LNDIRIREYVRLYLPSTQFPSSFLAQNMCTFPASPYVLLIRSYVVHGISRADFGIIDLLFMVSS